MSKFVVVVLPNEKNAYEALHAIEELHKEGTVTFYAGTVVERKADGKLDVKKAVDEGPLGLGLGSVVGGLVGLFGGPVGGAIGLATGGFVGAFIAEVSEDWLTPIDIKMEALGGTVVREYRDDFVEDRIEKHADAMRSEIEQRKAEHAGAKAEKMETKLEKRIDEARRDLETTASKARERLGQKKQEMLAKIEALQAQANKAKPEVQARIEQRITDIRAELQVREQKLSHAFELAEQALNP